eukprot:3340849-Rhodomonas_salina.3
MRPFVVLGVGLARACPDIASRRIGGGCSCNCSCGYGCVAVGCSGISSARRCRARVPPLHRARVCSAAVQSDQGRAGDAGTRPRLRAWHAMVGTDGERIAMPGLAAGASLGAEGGPRLEQAVSQLAGASVSSQDKIKCRDSPVLLGGGVSRRPYQTAFVRRCSLTVRCRGIRMHAPPTHGTKRAKPAVLSDVTSCGKDRWQQRRTVGSGVRRPRPMSRLDRDSQHAVSDDCGA